MFFSTKLIVLALVAALAAGGTAAMASPDLGASFASQLGVSMLDEPTATATALPTPTGTPEGKGKKDKDHPWWKVTPTATVQPTQTPVPSATVEPTPSATPSPTATPDPSATPEADEVIYKNHGAYVSEIARTTPPGPGHGEAVREAAHSTTGKAKFATDDDATDPDEDEPEEEEDADEALTTTSAKQQIQKIKPEPKGGKNKR